MHWNFGHQQNFDNTWCLANRESFRVLSRRFGLNRGNLFSHEMSFSNKKVSERHIEGNLWGIWTSCRKKIVDWIQLTLRELL